MNYLQQDCSDALVKIRVALRPADGVNLPPGSATAPVEQITLLAPGRNGVAGGKGHRSAAAESSKAAALHDEGTFEIDIEDLYWEQDVLLGRDGANGFAGFDLAGGLDLGLAPSGSGPLSQVSHTVDLQQILSLLIASSPELLLYVVLVSLQFAQQTLCQYSAY